MRFLVDAHIFDTLNQGSRTYLKGLYTSILRLNSTDDFFFAADSVSSIASELTYQANVHSLRYSGAGKYIRLGWDIPRLIKKNKIQWAHFQYIAPVLKTCEEIVTIHDLLFLEFPQYFPQGYRHVNNFLFKRSAKRAEHVLTVSEFSKQALIKYFDIKPEKIVLTANGILDFFWESNNGKDDVDNPEGLNQFILNVSRIEPRKNQAGLLKSFLDLHLWKQGIQLVFVGGKGIYTPEFTRHYHSLDSKIKKMIFILDDIPLRKLKWLYQNCLLFVYPSFAEGFGIPPLEALACGANVICSNATAMSEYLFLGDRLFDPNQAGEMPEKIDYFIKNPSEGNLIRTQKYIKDHYSWNTSAEQFLKIFK